MADIQDILRSGRASPADALAAWDALPAAPAEFMLGRWVGSGILTGHPMDGLLEHFNWHGKSFHDAENVDPLVFRFGNRLERLSPPPMFRAMALGDAIVRSAAMAAIFRATWWLFRAKRSAARLRVTGYRGKNTATMVYDQLPINDVFVQAGPNTAYGIMDLKGMTQPFFFLLRRADPKDGITLLKS